MGRRDHYRPIETPLSATSNPTDVVRGLLALHPFPTLYVADLDAIERRGNNDAMLRRLQAEFAGLTFWVDSGIADRAAAHAWLGAGLGKVVLGSEALPDAGLVHQFADDPRVILSLDFRDDASLGPPTLLTQPDHWPEQVIVMTLTRVGSGAGPDLARLSAIRAAAPAKKIYAAGGVRDGADLIALHKAGMAGALVATSLHDGRLSGPEIKRLTGPRMAPTERGAATGS
jgi:phosphoribosylformimino-5-aminoimidazole carboxamide ribotide isomerase